MTFIDEFGNEFQVRPSDVKRGLWISKKKKTTNKTIVI